MKHTRRRRHLRPRPSRAQIHHQIQRVSSNLQLCQLEWILEAQQEQPRQGRLRCLHDAIVAMRDDIACLEEM